MIQADKFEKIFHDERKEWPITLLPSIGHIPLTLNVDDVGATIEKIRRKPDDSLTL